MMVSAALVAVLAAPPALRADEVFTLTATKDATVDLALPTTNDGASAILRALSQSAGNRRNLVQFDLTGLDNTAAAKTSTLRMNMSTAPQASRNEAVHVVTGATQWTEGGVTWNTRDGATAWTTAGGDFNATAAASTATGTTPAALSWNVRTDGTISNIPQTWLTTPAQNLGLVVKDATEDDVPRAVIKQVLSGTSAVCVTPPNPCTTNIALAPVVDPARSFLIFGIRNVPTANVASTEITGEITAGNNIRFTRAGDNVAVNVDWFVVEYLQGVQVVRGTVTATPASRAVALPAPPTGVSSTSQMFALVSMRTSAADATFNRDNTVVGEITTTTNLNLNVGVANAGYSIHYQVVYFQNSADITVQRGNNSMTTGTTATSVLGTPVDPAKSFILASLRSTNATFAGNDTGARMVSAEFSGCTTTCTDVQFARDIAGSPDTITQLHYQVVTLNDGSTAQRGLQAFTGNPIQTDLTAGITSVDTTRSFAFASTQGISGQGSGRTSWATSQQPSTSGFGFTFTSGTQLRIRRNTPTVAAATRSAEVAWHVVEANNVLRNEVQYSSREDGTAANRPQLDVSLLRNVTPSPATAGISEVTLNWAMPSGSTGANYDGLLASRRQGGTPTFAPADGTPYTVGQVFGLDTVAANTSAFGNTSALDENGPDNVIAPGTSYTYRLHTHDAATITGAATAAPPHYAPGVDVSVTTDVPGPLTKNWSYKTAATALSAPSFIFQSNTLLTASNDLKLHSMDATTGMRRYQPGAAPLFPGITAGIVQTRAPVIPQAFLAAAVDCDPSTIGVQLCDKTFVGDSAGFVYAFDPATGRQLWSTQVTTTGGVFGAAAVQLNFASNAGFTPACAPCDLVVVGTRNTADPTNNKVIALDAANGSIMWTFDPMTDFGIPMDIVVSTPMVDYTNNFVYITSLSNGDTQPSLWKLESSTGALDDLASLGDISGSPNPSGTSTALYVVNDLGVLHAVRTDVGGCVTSSPAMGAPVGSPAPSVQGPQDEDIYFATATTIHKFHFTLVRGSCGADVLTDLNGSGWTDPSLTNPSGVVLIPTPLVPSAQIYIGDGLGHLLRIDAATGATAGSRDVELGQVISEPGIDFFGGRIFVGVATGRIYSFNFF